MTITAVLDIILILVLLAVTLLRWREDRRWRAGEWPAYEPGPAQDDGAGSPEPGTVAR